MSLLIPSWLDLATWAGVFFAIFTLIGLGRLLSLGRAAPEMALVAGWGGAALILTFWGIATPVSLRLPACGLVALAVLGLLLPRLRLSRAEWTGLLRLVVLALPLLAVMASVRPTQPDTFLNLLPNAGYLYDHGGFPADGLPSAHSYLPGAPYNMQLAAFLAALVTPGFPATAMIGLNVLFQLGAALLLARLVGGTEADDRAPSWTAIALGLLLALGLNPGFEPRYDLSDYSEPSVAVTLAFAGYLSARLIERLAHRREWGLCAWLLALSLAALVNIKQETIAPALGIVVGLAVLGLLTRAGARRALGATLAAAVPAALLYLAWRWYVLSHFATGGELKPEPLSRWQPQALPLILWHMLGVMGEKIVFFAPLAAVFVVLAYRLKQAGWTLATRAAAVLLGVVLVYNAALIFAYIGHFPGKMGADAHSYFRYNTHLSLLLMVAIVLLARETPALRRWIETRPWRGRARAAVIILAVVAPIAFLPLLRFDLEVPEMRARGLAREVAGAIGADAKLGLILPGDNGSLENVLQGLLRLTPPRRPGITLTTLRQFDAAALAKLDAQGYRLALVSCASGGFLGIPAGHAALLARGPEGWRAKAVYAYPPAPRKHHWSQIIVYAPLCLAG